LIKEPQKLSQQGLHVVAAAWTALPWMETNGDYSGFGFLKGEYNQEWLTKGSILAMTTF